MAKKKVLVFRSEEIYFHETGYKIKKQWYDAIKIGHSLDIIARSDKYKQAMPTSNLIQRAAIVFDQITGFSENIIKHNANLAYQQEQRILNKFYHLRVAPDLAGNEVVKDCTEIRVFMRKLKELDNIKDIKIKKIAVDHLFIDFPMEILFVKGKPTIYQVDLKNEVIISNFKVKEMDIEGRYQLNLNKAIFGQGKKIVTPEAFHKLIIAGKTGKGCKV